jgi:hypothetical protein
MVSGRPHLARGDLLLAMTLLGRLVFKTDLDASALPSMGIVVAAPGEVLRHE